MPNETLQLPPMSRVFEMEIDAAAMGQRAAGDERIPLVVSTELPVFQQRMGALEILDHGPDSVDLSRFKRGIALMAVMRGMGANHGYEGNAVQVGVVEDPVLGPDRRLRAMARFSRSAVAQEVKQDVLDGIRKYVSPGYNIQRVKPETIDGERALRATRWMPFEVTFVPTPADPQAGTGRSVDGATMPVEVEPPEPNAAPKAEGVRAMSEQTAAAAGNGAAPNGGGPVVTADHTTDVRAKELVALGREFGMEDKAMTWITEGTSIEGARRDVMATLSQRLKEGPKFAPRVDLKPEEHKQYSFARAILSAANGEASFERDISEQISRSLPQGYKSQGAGFYVPTNVQHRVPDGATGPSLMQRAGLDSITANKGSATVFDVPGSFIDLLRNKAITLRAGATMMSGLSSPITMPKQTAAVTAYWWAENHTAPVTVSEASFSTVSLTPKALMAATKYSKQLLRQSTIDVENFVRNDIARVYALALDLAALAGTGANNQPTGILTNTSVNTFALGTNGAAPTYANALRMVKEIEDDNADIGSQAYVTTPGVKYKWGTTQDFTSNGNPIWTGGPEGRVAGYPAYISNQVPANLTKGTSSTICSAIIFGTWAEEMIGEWGALELTVDPYTLAGYGMIAVTSFGMLDIAFKHPEAFCTIVDALTT